VVVAAVAFGEEAAAETAAYGHACSDDEQQDAAEGTSGDVRIKKYHDAEVHEDGKQDAQGGLRHGVPPVRNTILVKTIRRRATIFQCYEPVSITVSIPPGMFEIEYTYLPLHSRKIG
jgi:hypothetical protein